MCGVPSPAKRSAALLVSVYIDPAAVPRWRAHIHRFKDAVRNEKEWNEATSPDAVLEIVRHWLQSVSAN